jgi:hypothetical protein
MLSPRVFPSRTARSGITECFEIALPQRPHHHDGKEAAEGGAPPAHDLTLGWLLSEFIRAYVEKRSRDGGGGDGGGGGEAFFTGFAVRQHESLGPEERRYVDHTRVSLDLCLDEFLDQNPALLYAEHEDGVEQLWADEDVMRKPASNRGARYVYGHTPRGKAQGRR